MIFILNFTLLILTCLQQRKIYTKALCPIGQWEFGVNFLYFNFTAILNLLNISKLIQLKIWHLISFKISTVTLLAPLFSVILKLKVAFKLFGFFHSILYKYVKVGQSVWWIPWERHCGLTWNSNIHGKS